jgi:four helix bundle protein
MSFRELLAWQKAFELVLKVYKITKNFPKSEAYSLTSQIQRSAISIPANIAEGRERQHGKEYLQHLFIAKDLWARGKPIF